MTITNLTKEFIETNLVVYLPVPKRGRKPKAELWCYVKAIIHKFKTGTQWSELPVKQFFNIDISPNAVFKHFNKWSKIGAWKKLWTALLTKNKSKLALSSMQVDGSHTRVHNGGEKVAYQKRKKAKTSNALFFTDSKGIPVAMSQIMKGNHHDSYKIEKNMREMFADLECSKIETNALFLNADAGFDCKGFRQICKDYEVIPNVKHNPRGSKLSASEYIMDDKLYQERFVIERTNAWLDGFKTLLVRYEKTVQNWKSFHYIAFALILIKNN